MSKPSTRDGAVIGGFVVTILILIIGIIATVIRDIPHTRDIATPTATAAIVLADATTSTPLSPTIPKNPLPLALDTPKATNTKRYIEVTDGCAESYQGECLLVRSGPGKTYPVLAKLRTGVVLRVNDTATTSADGITWYTVVFDEWLRYPERLHGTWYIAADYVRVFTKPVVPDFVAGVTPTSTKRIVVDISEQKLFAYDGATLAITATTSTGLKSTPTPRGTFIIYKKTPTRYMQGPLPNIDSNQYYDLPGVPWNLYFTEGGAVIHGAYWHDSFGTRYSHGCVNLSVEDAHTVYDWADVGVTVTVKD